MNNDGYVAMWNNWAKKRNGVPVYDPWLNDFESVLEKNRGATILDLGCGNGADTLFLIERGFDVLSCDFSPEALRNVQTHIPQSKTKPVDLQKKLPFENQSFSLVIADLSLHYFDTNTTLQIMHEIKRILKTNGVLLARVATVEDVNFGAGVGQELEKNFYFEGAYTKRFFDCDDVKNFFGIVGKVEFKKTSLTRNEEEYSKPKKVFQIKVEKR